MNEQTAEQRTDRFVNNNVHSFLVRFRFGLQHNRHRTAGAVSVSILLQQLIQLLLTALCATQPLTDVVQAYERHIYMPDASKILSFKFKQSQAGAV